VRTLTLTFAAGLLLSLAAPNGSAALVSTTAHDSGTSDLTNFGPSVNITLVTGTQPVDTGTQVTALDDGGTSFLGSSAWIMETDSAGTVSMAWRNRATDETHRNPPLVPDFAAYICSDVVSVTGFGGTYALEMSYSPDVEHADDAAIDALNGHLFLGMLSTTGDQPKWINAGTPGDTYSTEPYSAEPFQGDFAEFRTTHVDPLAQYVGYWGVDIVDHKVWAVLDTQGQFAAVPEPSSIALLAAGSLSVLGLMWRARRNRSAAATAAICAA
jgi:hypothetical protein